MSKSNLSRKIGAIFWKFEKIVSKGDYNYVIVSDHPNATKHGYVLMHRAIMKNHLGRLLKPNEVAHHINHDRKDNRIKNLELMSASEHAKLHQNIKGRLWCELKCPECGNIFHKEKNQTFLQKGTNYTCCSRSCRGKFSRRVQLQGITEDVEQAISGNLVREYRKYSHDNPEQTV
jgi:RNase P subunit RPR2